MADFVLQGEPFQLNLSPEGFRRWAMDFYRCRQTFQSDHFSPVPYFLLCRAIELYFKSILLETRDIAIMKKYYSHDLIKAYNDFPPERKNLAPQEICLLRHSNKIYRQDAKGFEYFRVKDALTRFSAFPDLKDLDALAAKILI